MKTTHHINLDERDCTFEIVRDSVCVRMIRLIEIDYESPLPQDKARFEGILRQEMDGCGPVYQQIASEWADPPRLSNAYRKDEKT